MAAQTQQQGFLDLLQTAQDIHSSHIQRKVTTPKLKHYLSKRTSGLSSDIVVKNISIFLTGFKEKVAYAFQTHDTQLRETKSLEQVCLERDQEGKQIK